MIHRSITEIIAIHKIYYGTNRTVSSMANLYENIIQEIYRAIGAPGLTLIDCGANKGEHTLEMLKTGSFVYSFEPISHLACSLAEKISKMGYSKNLRIISLPVGNSNSPLIFHEVIGQEELSSFIPQQTNFPQASYLINAVRLDDIINTPVHFIKLDIEGFEFPALQGAKTILTKFRPPFVFEFDREKTSKRIGFSKFDFFNFFDEIEYNVSDILGTALTSELWGSHIDLPWYFVGWPKERSAEQLHEAIQNSVQKFSK